MSVAISACVTVGLSSSLLMMAVQDVNLSVGRWRVKVLLLISQPRMVCISAGVPSARILPNARRSSHGRGSAGCTGWPKMWSRRRVMRDPCQVAGWVARKHVKRSSR